MFDEDEAPTAKGGALATAAWADPAYVANRYFFEPGQIWLGRNPHNADEAIGHLDDRHVLVCAGSRGGKGRSFIVNNLALWPGSTVTYDPKGELPQMLAARRGQGDAHCEGMGQEVYVLDPLGHADVPEEYLAYFDPLSALDRSDADGELPTWAKRIAFDLIEIPESGDSAQWAKRASRLIALIILHVLTSEHYEDEDRNLLTVLRLILEGAEDARQRALELAPEGYDVSKIPDAHTILLDDMTQNPACRGWIASDARSMLRQAERTPKFLESVRGEAADQLDWFKSGGIERSLTGKLAGDTRMAESRRFDPARLKTDPKGASVFIVMPTDEMKTYAPWVQAVFTGIFAAMRRTKGAPASGHQTLGVLDEFSSLGYQEYIASSLDNIAGAGMKLCFIVQNFGTLKELYGDKIESFYTNSGLELYFGGVGPTATDYLQKELGEVEVVRLARSQNSSISKSKSTSIAISFGETTGAGGSETVTRGASTATSQGRQWSWSSGTNWSDSRNWGESRGANSGRNYGPHVFFEGLSASTNYGSSLNQSSGGAHTSGGSRVRGGGGSAQTTRSTNTSRAKAKSWTQSTSRTETRTDTNTKGYQIGQGVAETFHKKPLLEPHEMNAYLRPLDESEIDHPAYPGMALIRVRGESPFFVRRSNYDQDAYFERCFTPDAKFRFVPISERPLLGYEYTEAHLWTPELPRSTLLQAGVERHVRQHQMVEAGKELFCWEINSKAGDRLEEIAIDAPAPCRILETGDDANRPMSIRAATPIDSDLLQAGILNRLRSAHEFELRAAWGEGPWQHIGRFGRIVVLLWAFMVAIGTFQILIDTFVNCPRWSNLGVGGCLVRETSGETIPLFLARTLLLLGLYWIFSGRKRWREIKQLRSERRLFAERYGDAPKFQRSKSWWRSIW